ncbi:MAG TPA: ankyrin repeat domain-containing protein [Bryobacteraceae bacterium]|nr:ankyrin repeat domain-containing protein [Bryobacteraceae bacterium]
MPRSAITQATIFGAICCVMAGGAAPLWAMPGTPAIVEAAHNDDAGAVSALIAHHSDVNARAGDGMTALAWAAMRTNLDVARALLKAGANPDLANVIGVTPLVLAIQNGSDPLVRLLLESGAHANVSRTSGESPLMTAIRLGRIAAAKMLLDHGADVNAHENKFEQTALMWAAGQPDEVRLLLDHKADFRATTKSWDIKARKYGTGFNTLGRTGIPWVVEGEFDTKVGGYDALLFAVEQRDLESARMLIEAGADVNRAAADGTTPLLMSLYQFQVSSGGLDVDLPMASFLLDHGAKANVADLSGYTPLHGVALAVAGITNPRAAGRGGRRRPAPDGMETRPANRNPVAARAAAAVISRRGGLATGDIPQLAGLLAMAKRLLDAGADPNHQTVHPTPGPIGDTRVNPAPPGSSSFHVAATSKNVDLLRLMEEHGANPNLVDQEGHTPFSVAVKSGNLDDVKEMMAHGADLSARYNPADMIADPVESIARPRKGQTIMHVAVVAGQVSVIQYLYSQGVPLDLKNEAGETPLMLADSIERFRLAEAKQNGRNATRSTALTGAIQKLLTEGAPKQSAAVR